MHTAGWPRAATQECCKASCNANYSDPQYGVRSRTQTGAGLGGGSRDDGGGRTGGLGSALQMRPREGFGRREGGGARLEGDSTGWRGRREKFGRRGGGRRERFEWKGVEGECGGCVRQPGTARGRRGEESGQGDECGGSVRRVGRREREREGKESEEGKITVISLSLRT